MLVKKGLTELAKKVPTLGPLVRLAKGNPVALTIQFTFADSGPGYHNINDEVKEKRIEALRLKTIGALLFLFENNNKLRKVQVVEPEVHIEKNPSDNTRVAMPHPEFLLDN